MDLGAVVDARRDLHFQTASAWQPHQPDGPLVGFFQRDIDGIFGGRRFCWPWSKITLPHIIKQTFEDAAAHAGEGNRVVAALTGPAEPAPAPPCRLLDAFGVGPVVAVSIVPAAFGLVGQNAVSLVDLLEFFLRRFLATVHVGVELPGHAAVSLPDVFLAGIPGNAQYVIEIGHGNAPVLLDNSIAKLIGSVNVSSLIPVLKLVLMYKDT